MVNPAIFGTLFQQSLEAAERHALGAHFTSEADIQKVIRPTIVAPLRKRLDAAKTLKEYQALRRDIVSFRVLDPACGSGNFLYVAYRELKRLERELLAQVEEEFSEGTASKMKGVGVRLTNFFGIDIEPRAVAVARTTMALARELALLEDYGDVTQAALSFEPPLPLENIDDNILVADALFTDWPNADAIVGNPPFLDARKLTMEHGKDYANRVRAAYPDVPGRADFCVYWFRKTHDTLRPGHRAGLVGTNSIRQNYSREGGLDYVLANGGTITEAVSTQDWSGDAAVHVSIVNWVKGAAEGPHILHSQDTESTDKAWSRREVSRIGASLAYGVELSEAKAIPSNIKPKVCFEGQQPGHKGFVLSRAERSAIITADPKSADIIYPYVNGSQILTGKYTHAPRWVIDYGAVGRLDAAKQHGAFAHLEQRVLPDWQAKAHAERQKTGRSTGEHQRRLEQWWILKRRRADMLDALDGKHRYLACVRVSKRAIFFFIDAGTRPDSALSVFALDDDYSFGVLHSDLFRAWSVRKGSSLKGDPRFTPDTGFRTYPWPQSPSTKAVNAVAEAARNLREVRAKHLPAFRGSLRDLYQANEGPGRSSLKDAQREIDGKVRQAYGLKKKASVDSALAELLELNDQLVTREQDGDPVQGPGVPLGIADSKVRSDDAISPPSA
jgi:SAM-dependent methyltransferase